MTINRLTFGNQPKSTEQPKAKLNVAGTVGSAAAALGINTAVREVAGTVGLCGMRKVCDSFSPEEMKQMQNAANEVLKNKTNLAQKGVKVVNMSQGCKLNPKNAVENAYATAINQAMEGQNAFFQAKPIKCGDIKIDANSVVVNTEKMPSALFHEFGHAHNYNNSAFWKTMQKARTPGMLLATFFMLFPAFTKETKAKEGEELTKGQKFKNGLRKASPFLTVGAMMPVILEEGMASLKACKFTKGLLDKGLASKINKQNLFGLLTYVGLAAGMGIASYAARKIKDKSQEKRAQKVQQIMQNSNPQNNEQQTKIN